MQHETVIEELHAGVVTLTMNRPKQRNALNTAMYRELGRALSAARENDDVGAVVITGTQGIFCAGQDLDEMAAFAGGAEGGDTHAFPGFMDCLCQFDKPLLAAVNGAGVGIGLTMLLHCDIVYIADGARLRAPFVPLGVVPEAASSFLLPAIIGYQRAADVLFTAEWIDAQRAFELGIASRICPPDELLPAVRAKAERIAAGPVGALQCTKRLLLATRSDQVRAALARELDMFRERLGTPENLEAFRSFFEKRQAGSGKPKAEGEM